MPCVPSTPATGSLIIRGASGVVTAASNAPAFRKEVGGGGFEYIWSVEPPSIAENFVVTVRNMTAALIEKQYELLARASAAPLELPPALPKPNAYDFPTSQKRKMTGHEAAMQEEIDAAVRRRREVIEAGVEYNDRRHYTEQAVRDIIERHSQRQKPLPSPPPATSFLLLLLPPLGTASPPTNLGLGEVSGGHKS